MAVDGPHGRKSAEVGAIDHWRAAPAGIDRKPRAEAAGARPPWGPTTNDETVRPMTSKIAVFRFPIVFPIVRRARPKAPGGRLRAAALMLAVLAATPAAAGFFSSQPLPPAAAVRTAQYVDPAQQMVRIDNLESQVRQLTGRIDELNHQIQMLQSLLKRAQEDNEFRFQQLEGGKPRKSSDAGPALAPAQPAQTAAAPAGSSFSVDGGLGAPPQPLGTLSAPMAADAGAPSESAVGGPLDLSALARGEEPAIPPAADTADTAAPTLDNSLSAGTSSATLAPPPAVAAPPAGDRIAALQAANDPDAAYDAAYASIVAGDYAAAEAAFKRFLADFSKDRQAGNARYWLGESYYARKQYRDAATAFLSAYKDYPKNPKAPDSLLKLGLSLEGLGETSAACATYGELVKKFPKAQSAILGRVTTQRTKLGCP